MRAVRAHDPDLNEPEEGNDDGDPDDQRYQPNREDARPTHQEARKADQVEVKKVSRAEVTLDGFGCIAPCAVCGLTGCYGGR